MMNQSHVIRLEDILSISDLQNLQDMFADVHGVASVITDVDGKPITKPSKFTRLCECIIRKTAVGCANCFHSDAIIGRSNSTGAIVQPCLSGGLWDAGASITVGGMHIANWLVGQVRNDTMNEAEMLKYAETIGADKDEFLQALNEVPVMSVEQFTKVANLLFLFAKELSEKAYNIIKLNSDFSEKYKEHKFIQDNEMRFRGLLKNLEAGVVVHAPDTSIVLCNTKAAQILGLNVDQINSIYPLDKDWNFIDENKNPILIKDYPVNQILHSKKSLKSFILGIVNSNDDAVIWVNVNGFPVLDLNSNVVEIVISFIDVSDQKRAEDELQESNRMRSALINNLPGFLYRCKNDKNWTMEFISEGCTAITGYSSSDLIANKTLSFNDLIVPQYRESIYNKWIDALQNRVNLELEYPILTASGNVKWLWERGQGVFNSNGDLLFLEGFITDITEKRLSIEKIEASEYQLKAMLNAVPDLIFRINAKGVILSYKADVKDLYYDSDILVGLNYQDLMPDYLVEIIRENITQVITTGNIQTFEYELEIPEKGMCVFEARMSKSGDYEVTTLIRDVTEQKHTELELKESMERYKALHNASFGGIAIHKNGVILDCNQGLSKMTGFSIDELNGLDCLLLIDAEYRELVKNHIEIGFEKRYEAVGVRKNGDKYPIRLESRVIPFKGEMVQSIEFRDITARKIAEEELRDSREHLRNFASNLQKAREDERASLALEIHDSLAQYLVALKMDIGLFKKKVTKPDEILSKELIGEKMDQLILQVDNANKVARRIMNGLRPEQLELLGFVEAAEVYLREFEKNHHITCTFQNSIQHTYIPFDQTLALFRILQETLHNILKHAMATQVVVSLRAVNQKIEMQVVDNGVGFDVGVKGRFDSYGLIGMKERVKLLMGDFELTSALGQGTSVRVEIPIL